MDLRERLGIEHPIVQTGMAGGLATAELAAAVSRAGGLGTLGLLSPTSLATELARAREEAPGRALAVNLLLPFTRPAHVEVCIRARVTAVTLFFGFAAGAVARLRDAGIFVLHQVGTLEGARRALAEGADALIAQGEEAGGHLLGRAPSLTFLREALIVAAGKPVLLAGGVAEAGDVRAALAAGAAGVVCGSRFLLTHECRAHAGYKRRVLGAERTIVTELFGLGWPARHRVVPNAATERWCRSDPAGPWFARSIERGTAWLAKVMPMSTGGRLVAAQRLSVPFFSPSSLLEGADDALLDVTPLYAGACVRKIREVRPAGEVVRDLAAGCR